MKYYDTIVMGAGPAGLFAAIHREGGSVLVLEKNPVPGKKLLIAGSGQCNLTHDEPISRFAEHYGKAGKFLKPALFEFTNRDLAAFFASYRLGVVTDKNGKMFPETRRSRDVLEILLAASAENKVNFSFSQAVKDIVFKDGMFTVSALQDTFTCKSLVIATGGKSYPATGSTGDGYAFAEKLGHTIVSPKPALCPVFARNYRLAEIAGISLEDRELYLYRDGKKIDQHRGDVGFTHKGISGPGILDFSRQFREGDILKINMAGEHPDRLRALLIEAAGSSGKTPVSAFFRKFDIPRNLVKAVLEQAVMDAECNLASVDRKSRNLLVSLFSEYPMEIGSLGGYNYAMVTSGGVSLDEVNPKTMESRIVPGLYFAGEVLDIDGDTGGYNLQAAFSTGYVAGKAISAEN